MARTKRRSATTAIATRRRSGPSPLTIKLREQLASTRKRASALAKSAKENDGGMAAVKAGGLAAAGGAAGGAINVFAPPGVVATAAKLGGGLALVALGGFALKGSASAAVVCFGSGLLAKGAGDAVEDVAAIAGVGG